MQRFLVLLHPNHKCLALHTAFLAVLTAGSPALSVIEGVRRFEAQPVGGGFRQSPAVLM